MIEHLQNKKRFLVFLCVLLISLGKVFASHYTVSYTYSGTTLYYLLNTTAHTATVTYPDDSGRDNLWYGYTKPSGNVTIPASFTVASGTFAGTYTVTNIGEYMTQVTVYQDGTATNEDGIIEQVPSDTKPLVLDKEASGTITIKEGEYISIFEPAVIQLVAE